MLNCDPSTLYNAMSTNTAAQIMNSIVVANISFTLERRCVLHFRVGFSTVYIHVLYCTIQVYSRAPPGALVGSKAYACALDPTTDWTLACTEYDRTSRACCVETLASHSRTNRKVPVWHLFHRHQSQRKVRPHSSCKTLMVLWRPLPYGIECFVSGYNLVLIWSSFGINLLLSYVQSSLE